MSVLKELINANNSLSQGKPTKVTSRAKVRARNRYPLDNSKRALQVFFGGAFKYSSIVPPVILEIVNAKDAKSKYGYSITEGSALLAVHTTVTGVESVSSLGLKELIADLEDPLSRSASKDGVEYLESFNDTPKGSYFTLCSLFVGSDFFSIEV